MKFTALLLIASIVVLARPVGAETKAELKMSIVVNDETTWGRAAVRFAEGIAYRTSGRIQIKNYFDAKLFPRRQTTEFELLQRGGADFAIGSTINWSPQVKELNLFALPFMLENYEAVDAIEGSAPGKTLFQKIEANGVVPIAWGENGFREITNSRRPVHRPADLFGLKFRVVGAPIFVDTFRVLGTDPISLSWDEALVALRGGEVDGQENPVPLIIPYKIYAIHPYLTLWHYAIDPLVLAVNGKTWQALSPEDQLIIRQVGGDVMAEQKREAREGLENSTVLTDRLRSIYGMDVVNLRPAELEAFREATRPVYLKWAQQIGIDLVRSAERSFGR